MASFNTSTVSVSFTGDGSDFEESREAKVAIQDIPGGDTFYADRGGRGPLRWRLGAVLLNSTVWGQLNSVVGDEGSLNVETFDGHTAILMRVSRPVPFADAQVKCSVEFLITDT